MLSGVFPLPSSHPVEGSIDGKKKKILFYMRKNSEAPSRLATNTRSENELLIIIGLLLLQTL